LAEAPLSVQFSAPARPGQYEISGTVTSQTNDPDLSNNQDQIEFDVVDEGNPLPPAPQPIHIPALDSSAMLVFLPVRVGAGLEDTRKIGRRRLRQGAEVAVATATRPVGR